MAKAAAAPRGGQRKGHVTRRHGQVRLPVIADRGWSPREGLPPGGRDECRHGERPCPYVRCWYHLWRIDTEDREGKPHNGKRAPTTLRPRWLEYPTPACCGADLIEQDPIDTPVAVRLHMETPAGEKVSLKIRPARSAKEIGRALGITARRVSQIVKVALRKLARVAGAKELLKEMLFR